jgi:hypothetical protein
MRCNIIWATALLEVTNITGSNVITASHISDACLPNRTQVEVHEDRDLIPNPRKRRGRDLHLPS